MGYISLEPVKLELAECITGKGADELTKEDIERLDLDDLTISWVELEKEISNGNI